MFFNISSGKTVQFWVHVLSYKPPVIAFETNKAPEGGDDSPFGRLMTAILLDAYLMSMTAWCRFTNKRRRSCLILPDAQARSSRSTALSGMDFKRPESNTTLGDCEQALRRFFSMAFMLAPLGAFISHGSPAIMRSADFSYWPSRRSANSMTYPAAARAFAVASSWGQILTPEGMMIFPDDLTMPRILAERRPRLSSFVNMRMHRLGSGLAPRHGCAMRYRPCGRCPRPRGAGPLR